MAHRRDILRGRRISGRDAFGFLRARGRRFSNSYDRARDKPQALPRGRGTAGKRRPSPPNGSYGQNFAQIYPDRAYLFADFSRARAKFTRPAPGVFFTFIIRYFSSTSRQTPSRGTNSSFIYWTAADINLKPPRYAFTCYVWCLFSGFSCRFFSLFIFRIFSFYARLRA